MTANTLQAHTLDLDDQHSRARAEELLQRVERIDGQSPVSDQARVAARLGSRELTLFTRGGEAVAVGIVGEGELDLAVHPDVRGQGIGTASLKMIIGARPAAEDLKSWVHGDQPAATRLLTAAGFAPVRLLLRMELDPTLLPPVGTSTPFPDGFRIEQYDPASDRQRQAIVDVNSRAFADHPEQGSLTVEGFLALTQEPWFRAADLKLCTAADGALAGFTWMKRTETEEGETETELYVLAVHPVFSGKGLGRKLLSITLSDMAAEHPRTVSLYVEADNAPARTLYERAGFVIAKRSEQWHRVAHSQVPE